MAGAEGLRTRTSPRFDRTIAAVARSARDFARGAKLGFKSIATDEKNTPSERECFFGRGRRTRTHDPWFWRPVLYQLSYTPVYGAGDGNRTRTASLEGWNSTIELHPQGKLDPIIIAQLIFDVKPFLKKFCAARSPPRFFAFAAARFTKSGGKG